MNAKMAYQLMSRIERAAATVRSDRSSHETVRSALVALLKQDASAVAPFVAKLLSGGFGGDASLVGWRSCVARGLVIAGEDTPNPVWASFAAYCMFRGRLDILREVVFQVPLDSVPPELRPADRSRLLDLLSKTKFERDDPSFLGTDSFTGLAGFAAANAGDCAHAYEALELAWEVDRKHCAFDILAQEASEEGAFVRAFLMNKGIELAAAADVAVDDVAPAPSRTRPTRGV